MNVDVKYDDFILTVTLEGRLTAERYDEIAACFKKAASDHPDAGQIYIDFKQISYISSAGLRALLMLQKQTGIKLHLENVADDVMDIFQTTGYTELMHIRKPFKELTVDKSKLIGKGRIGAVYRLDEERVIKVCFDKSGSTLAKIDRDRDISQALFLKGIPTAIPYDVVITDEGYGVIYELLEGESILRYIYTHPEKLKVVVPKIGKLIRKLHTTDAGDLKLKNANDLVKKQLSLVLNMVPEEKMEKLKDFIDHIPERTTLIHGDLNMGNIMIMDKGDGTEPEPLLIDIADVMTGHPIFDFQGIYLSAASADRAFSGTPVGEMSKQMALQMEMTSAELFGESLKDNSGALVRYSELYWQELIKGYFDIENDEDLIKADECLCEIGRSSFLRPSKKEGKGGEVMDIILDVFVNNIDKLDRLFDLNW
ncbi:MAG: phosphotransferase [Lachnospiraceae bacterium]|nr:phosphotransferase [Lachnospiraceae bacterium]